MAFISTLGAIVKGATKLSEIVNTFNNTRINKDAVQGDDGEGTGTAIHTHDLSSTTSEGQSTTTSGGFVQKVSHSFTPVVAGNYIIQWQAEISHSIASGRMQVQADLDGGTQIGFCDYSPVAANAFCVFSGFIISNLTAAAHTVDIDFLRQSGSGNALIRRARVTTWKVS